MDRISWTCATATGGRNRNEDTFRWRHAPSLALDGDHPVAVVCDGLGGHAHGEIASNTAAEAFMQAYLTGCPAGSTVPQRMLAAVHAANDAIGLRCEQDPKLYEMGTTLTAAAVTAQGLWRISVGDSPLRVWSKRNGELRQLNRLHNVTGNPHRLSSALLGSEIAEIHAPIHAMPLRAGDAVIVASDGLDTLTAETISAIAAMDASLPGSNLAWSLIEAVIAAGKERQDNTTAVCLRMPEDTGRGPDTLCAIRGADDSMVTIGGKPLDWQASLAVRNHSPTGPE
ncbi:MAG: SpoIIE family protein phosphatase [Acidobacteria bacterium]|nr:SpoIIE family protein phosphatase [Acidobacteriota bacterium]